MSSTTPLPTAEPLTRSPTLSGQSHPAVGAKRSSEAPSLRRPMVLLLPLLVVLLCEIGATLVQHFTAATDQDWQETAEKLRILHKPGEPIIFAPYWLSPLVRRHLGAMVDSEQFLLSDVDRFSRVWLVRLQGAEHPWLEGHSPKQSFSTGALTLSEYEKEAVQVVYDFTAEIAQAQVERVGDTLTQCAWKNERFSCDKKQGWNWVGRYLAEVDHRPYRCVYAHPVDGHLMRVTFDDVPLGQELVGYTGIDDFESRKRADKPVTLRVSVDGDLLGQVVHQNHWGWHRFSFPLKGKNGQNGSVRFEVSAKNAYARPFCFAAEMRR